MSRASRSSGALLPERYRRRVSRVDIPKEAFLAALKLAASSVAEEQTVCIADFRRTDYLKERNPRQRRNFVRIRKNGKISIELTVKEYEKLLEDLEELDAIRAYDEAKSSDEQPIPLDHAITEIERSRR